MKRIVAVIFLLLVALLFSACSAGGQLPPAEIDWRAYTSIMGYKSFTRAGEDISTCICIKKDGIYVYYDLPEQELFGLAKFPEEFSVAEEDLIALHNDDINEDGNSDLTAIYKNDERNAQLSWIYNIETQTFDYSEENSEITKKSTWEPDAKFKHNIAFTTTNNWIKLYDYTVNVKTFCLYKYNIDERIDDALVLADGNNYVISRIVTEKFNNKNVTAKDYAANYNNTVIAKDIKTLFSLTENPSLNVNSVDTSSNTTDGISSSEGTLKSSKFNGNVKTHIYIDSETGNIIAKTIVAESAEEITQIGDEVRNTQFCS